MILFYEVLNNFLPATTNLSQVSWPAEDASALPKPSASLSVQAGPQRLGLGPEERKDLTACTVCRERLSLLPMKNAITRLRAEGDEEERTTTLSLNTLLRQRLTPGPFVEGRSGGQIDAFASCSHQDQSSPREKNLVERKTSCSIFVLKKILFYELPRCWRQRPQSAVTSKWLKFPA